MKSLSLAALALAGALFAAPLSALAEEPDAPAAEAPKGDADEVPRTDGGGSHTRWKRDGVNPCMTPDPGFLAYDKWENVALGQIVAPQRGGIRKDGGFDLVVHFHGHEPTRKEFVKVGSGIVLAGIDLGLGSGPYEDRFADASLFPRIVESIEQKMKKRTGNARAHVRHLALSSWSAGYGAISRILRQEEGKKVEAVILLDSLHAGLDEKKRVRGGGIEQFVDYARLATKKKRFMFLSHSSIIPPGYASTTDVAKYIVGELGGTLKKASRKDVLGLEMLDRFDKGDFHVRGYDGNDKPDHCAHIGLIRDVVKVHLAPRWKTPKAREEKPSDDRATDKKPKVEAPRDKKTKRG